MSIYTALALAYDLCLAAVCLYAWRQGGRDERRAALAVLVASTATVLLWVLPTFRWHTSQDELLVIETGLLGVLVAIALKSDRFWPLWAAAFQLIATVTQALGLIEPEHVHRAYVMLQGVWAYPILLSIAIGTRVQRRLRRRATAANRSR